MAKRVNPFRKLFIKRLNINLFDFKPVPVRKERKKPVLIPVDINIVKNFSFKGTGIAAKVMINNT
jgi:hypothetical protein